MIQTAEAVSSGSNGSEPQVQRYSPGTVEFSMRVLETNYDFNIDATGVETLEYVRSYLTENWFVTPILYFNHISFGEPPVAMWVYRRFIDPNSNRRVFIPTSYSHLGFRDPMFTVGVFAGSILMRYKYVPVIQGYQVREKRYTEKAARRTYRRLQERIMAAHRSGQVAVCIAPEGTRSQDGTLQKAESGVRKLTQNLWPALPIPLGISYSGEFNRSGLHLGETVYIRVGDPLFPELVNGPGERVHKRPDMDDLMIRLALALPEHMRGIWRERLKVVA